MSAQLAAIKIVLPEDQVAKFMKHIQDLMDAAEFDIYDARPFGATTTPEGN